MAKYIGDPPGFERWARAGTPQDHIDQHHDIRVEHDDWCCTTCNRADNLRLQAEEESRGRRALAIVAKAHAAGVLADLELTDRERALLHQL
jgi:hypothetical protein